MRASVDRKPGPSFRFSIAVMAVGVLLAVPAGAVIAVRFLPTIGTPGVTTPATLRRHLTAGTWHVFQRTGWKSGIGGFTVSRNNAPTLQPTDVTVTGSDGGQLPVSYVTTNETITQNSTIYTGVVGFRVRTADVYTIQVSTPDSEVLVARSLGDTFRSMIAPGAVGAAGGMLLTIGLVLLIIGASRRREVTPLPALHSEAPPGWYPDSPATGRLRWWDGRHWTEHQA